MRGGLLGRLLKAQRAAVAPTVGISLFALIGVGGIAFDYARLAAMDSELQNAADMAALAAASQLDGQAGAISRATSAAQNLITNNTRFANDGVGSAISVPTLVFYDGYETKDVNGVILEKYGNITIDDATARFVQVTVDDREAFYALTPVVEAFSSGEIEATALAGVGEAICKVPPVMICNPDEPSTNTNLNLAFTPAAGVGLQLVTGNADAPGNFGWLYAGLGNGAPGLSDVLGNDAPAVDCQPTDGVTTLTGMKEAVMNAINTRFDIFSNGAQTCSSGTCSPSTNTRKDMVCTPNSTSSACTGDNFDIPSNSYVQPAYPPRALQTGDTYPSIMGYPPDICHMVTKKQTAICGIVGSGTWDREAFFDVNYGPTYDWAAAMTAAGHTPSTVTRYQVYNWELSHQSVNVAGVNKGIGIAQSIGSNKAAFGIPATGRSGISPASGNDRRRISVAVLNCEALELNGKTNGIPVPNWLDVFLVQPVAKRGNGNNTYTDMSDVYVEVIGSTGSGTGGASSAQVIQRSVPYLIK